MLNLPGILRGLLPLAAVAVFWLPAALSSEGGAYDVSKEDLPNFPFTNAARRAGLKNVPIGDSGFKFSLGGTEQVRFQSLNNRRDYLDRISDKDTSILTKTRLNATIYKDQFFKFFAEAQDAHEFFNTKPARGVDNINENELDLYQAYLEFGLLLDVVDKPSLRFRVGRQELVYDHEYLIGDRDWFNRGQVFDAAQARWRPDGFEIDFLWARPVEFNNHNWDTTSDTSLAGYHLTALGVPGGHKLASYAWYKWNSQRAFRGEDGSRGGEYLWTFGGVAEGNFAKRWDYAAELAINAGERGGDSANSFRIDGHVGYTIPIQWRSVRLGLSYTYATGDKNPFDGKAGTFDSLFPDPFLFHGRTLIAAGTNLRDLTAHLTARVWRGGMIEFEYHHLRLARSRDALFHALTFTPLRRDRTGRAGREVGGEIDLQITHKFHENMSITGGGFFFFPGTFFERTKTRTRGDDTARNIFMMFKISF